MLEEFVANEATIVNSGYTVCSSPTWLKPNQTILLGITYNFVNIYDVAVLDVEKGFSGNIVDVAPRFASLFSNASIVVNVSIHVAFAPETLNQVRYSIACLRILYIRLAAG